MNAANGVLLRASCQEEVGELKAELRKAMSEAKNAERRISAGVGGRRSAGGGGAFGFKAKGGDGGGVAPGKGPPHTPSRKLSEAKNRCVFFFRFINGFIHDFVRNKIYFKI